MPNTTNNPIRKAREIIRKSKLDIQEKNGISITTLGNQAQGFRLTKNILYKLVDKDTVLFLSGGSTPKPLYHDLAKEKRLNVGAVAMVDERYGSKNHKNSNERMIKETGLISYLNLHLEGVKLNRVKKLLSSFPKKVAIMGIGEDGHTAGIAPNRKDFENPLFNQGRKDLLVDSFNDPKSMEEGGFGERITLTFKALSKMDLLLVLVFGKNKKSALINMFKEGSIEEIPARFYKRVDIACKTLLITDQKV